MNFGNKKHQAQDSTGHPARQDLDEGELGGKISFDVVSGDTSQASRPFSRVRFSQMLFYPLFGLHRDCRICRPFSRYCLLVGMVPPRMLQFQLRAAVSIPNR